MDLNLEGEKERKSVDVGHSGATGKTSRLGGKLTNQDLRCCQASDGCEGAAGPATPPFHQIHPACAEWQVPKIDGQKRVSLKGP
jgi:hypothetical protein